MQETQDSRIPDDRRYTTEHIWIRRDGDAFVCGITDFAQDQLDEVVYVGLPAPGSAFAAGESFGTVESMKSTNELFMPVTGVVIEVNATLEESPELVNSEPYADGWLIRVKPEHPDAFETSDRLLTPAGYAAFLRQS